jgi:hypothetical protein
MSTTRTRDLMTITLEKAIEQYLITLGTEGKSPRYLGWSVHRLLGEHPEHYLSWSREPKRDGK